MRLLALLLAAPLTALAQADVEKVLRRDFQARGQATMDRVVPDALQRVCNETGNKPPAELAKALEADQLKTIVFPSGSLLGSWQRGERIAQGGRGLTWSDKPGTANDGNVFVSGA